MTIEDIVNVQITRETTAISRLGFGTLLIAGEHNRFVPRVKYYANIEEMTADGFIAADEEYIAALAVFGQNPRPNRIAIGRIADGDDDIAESLDTISAEDDDWYGLMLVSRVAADVTGAAAWTQARSKIFGTASEAAAVLDATSNGDIAATLKTSGHSRTFVIYHASAATIYPEAAWFGTQLPTDPGSSTWAFKDLEGIPVSSLSLAQRTAVLDKNANTFELRAGSRITREGKMASGEYIDIIRGIDWLEARLTERIFGRLVNAPKIPYTDAGVAIIEGEIRAQLDQAIAQGVLAVDPEPAISTPLVSQVSANDRANRMLPNVTFTATLQGAVQSININGIVTI